MRYLTIASFLAGCLAAWSVIVARARPAMKVAVFGLLLSAVATWTVALLWARPVVFNPAFAVWVIVPALLGAAFCCDSVLSNVAALNRVRVSPIISLLTATLTVSAFVHHYWLLAGIAAPQRDGSIVWTVSSLVLSVVTHLVLLVCVGLCSSALIGRTLTPHPIWFNLFQDGLLFTGLVVTFLFLPLFVSRHLEADSLSRLGDALLVFGPVVGPAGTVFVLILGNNVGHLRRKVQEASTMTRTQLVTRMPVDALGRHIRVQNRLAIATAVLSGVGIGEAVKNWKEIPRLWSG